MQILNPFAFIALLLAIPIILMYMLKLRRKQTQVSSVMLWQKALREKQANTPWQKLKRSLLLFLQLLILFALVFALSRPALQTPVAASGQVIVLLDASASMNATDIQPNRFEAAKQAALGLINGLSGESSMTLILAGYSPQTLIAAETNKPLLRAALNQAVVTQGAADWHGAFALAAGASRGNAESTVVIISDGGLPSSGLPPLSGTVRYLPVGSSNENLAISALALRAVRGKPQLFAEVSNYGSALRKPIFSLYIGDELFLARQIEVAPGKAYTLILDDLPAASAVYKAQIADAVSSSRFDMLALDDTAFAVYQASSARRALLVSRGNLFLEQLLASLPGIQPFRALPAVDGAIQLPNESFDLYIFDGVLPAELPRANLLLINPPSNPLFKVGELHQETSNAQVKEHSLTRYVDWKNVHVLQASRVELPSWMTVLVESDSNPLVFAGERGGQRVASLSFDLKQSDLPLQIAYPILFSNLINYLAPPSAFDASRSLSAGESLAIAAPTDAGRILVVSPSNLVYSLALSQPLFSQTHELGYYAVNFVTEDFTRAEYFAVNLFDPAESDITPRASVQVGAQTISAAFPQQTGLLELWKWLAALALAVLIIEWQVFHQKKLFR